MTTELIIGGAVAAFAGLVYWLHKRGVFAGIPASLPVGNLPADNPFASPVPAPSGIGGQYNGVILAVAAREGIDPVLLKAIVKKETNFDEEAVNPEQSFWLYGKQYSAGSSAGRRALRDFINGGGDPATIGLNPSLGLAQVRVSNGKHFIPGIDPIQLFDPETNLTAAARLIRELVNAGITLQTIDAYNVGQDLSPRNLPYRDEVRANYALFRGDFQ